VPIPAAMGEFRFSTAALVGDATVWAFVLTSKLRSAKRSSTSEPLEDTDTCDMAELLLECEAAVRPDDAAVVFLRPFFLAPFSVGASSAILTTLLDKTSRLVALADLGPFGFRSLMVHRTTAESEFSSWIFTFSAVR